MKTDTLFSGEPAIRILPSATTLAILGLHFFSPDVLLGAGPGLAFLFSASWIFVEVIGYCCFRFLRGGLQP